MLRRGRTGKEDYNMTVLTEPKRLAAVDDIDLARASV